MNTKITEMVADIIQNAIDYIGNKKTDFAPNVDEQAIKDILDNKHFHQRVVDEIVGDLDEYVEETTNQEAAAQFIWKLYVEWAYGPQ